MNYINRAIEARKELHRIPEIGLKEYKTSEYLKRQLESMGYSFTTVVGTGIIAWKNFDKKKTSLAFRADMDGIPVIEENNLEYKSVHEGMMHACGHDIHMAVLIGLADFLKNEKTSENIVFVFQPAEESPGGAKPIMETGILDELEVKQIYGMHVWPFIPQGKIGLRKGPLMAMPGEFEITVKGMGGHGAFPEKTQNTIYIAACIIREINELYSNSEEIEEKAVITAGYINGGTKHNIIPEKVKFGGTFRLFSKEKYSEMKEKIRRIVFEQEKEHSVEIDLKITDFYSVVNNDNNLTEEFFHALSDTAEVAEPAMTGEDFSAYQEKIPGVYFFLDSYNKEKGYVHPLHSSKFNVDEAVIKNGIDAYIKLLIYKKII